MIIQYEPWSRFTEETPLHDTCHTLPRQRRRLKRIRTGCPRGSGTTWASQCRQFSQPHFVLFGCRVSSAMIPCSIWSLDRKKFGRCMALKPIAAWEHVAVLPVASLTFPWIPISRRIDDVVASTDKVKMPIMIHIPQVSRAEPPLNILSFSILGSVPRFQSETNG